MADAYPWGSQAPSARLAKLQRDLTKNTETKASYLETHKAKIAEFDDTDKRLKADIRACEAIIDREQREAQGEQLSKLLQRLSGSGKVDLGALLSDPNLEKKLAALSAEGGAAGESKKAKADKKPKAAEGAGAEVEA